MTSPTAKHVNRRDHKLTKMGKQRKNDLRNYGSTIPNLPLDKPNANELKQTAKSKVKKAKIATKSMKAKKA